MLIPAFSSIVLDCCQHLFQGQVLPVPKTDKHNVQFIDTELSDEERTSVYVYVSVFVFEIQRQNKRDALRSHRFRFALGGSSGGNAGRRFQPSAQPGFEGCVCSGGFAVLGPGAGRSLGKRQWQLVLAVPFTPGASVLGDCLCCRRSSLTSRETDTP